MTYIPAPRIEESAAELWQRHCLAPGFDVEQLLDDLGLGLVWEPIEDEEGAIILGQLIPGEKLVVLNEKHLEKLEYKQGRLRRFTVGHEIGHWFLHAHLGRAGALTLIENERTWCRDGSHDPLERQAEMFSAALLMPKDRLGAELPGLAWHGWPWVFRLCDRFLVNTTPMLIRLEGLGWMHRDEHDVPTAGPAPVPGQSSLFSS